MCCKSWKTFLPFFVTFLLGISAVIPFQALKTEMKFREVRTELTSAHKNGTDSATCSSHSKFNSDLSVKSNLKPLQILFKPKANYTDAARQNETQGTITLRVSFLANGKVGNVATVNYLPDGLTEEAIEAAKQMKFEPAMLNGKPITVTKQVQYTFTLY